MSRGLSLNVLERREKIVETLFDVLFKVFILNLFIIDHGCLKSILSDHSTLVKPLNSVLNKVSVLYDDYLCILWFYQSYLLKPFNIGPHNSISDYFCLDHLAAESAAECTGVLDQILYFKYNRRLSLTAIFLVGSRIPQYLVLNCKVSRILNSESYYDKG